MRPAPAALPLRPRRCRYRCCYGLAAFSVSIYAAPLPRPCCCLCRCLCRCGLAAAAVCIYAAPPPRPRRCLYLCSPAAAASPLSLLLSLSLRRPRRRFCAARAALPVPAPPPRGALPVPAPPPRAASRPSLLLWLARPWRSSDDRHQAAPPLLWICSCSYSHSHSRRPWCSCSCCCCCFTWDGKFQLGRSRLHARRSLGAMSCAQHARTPAQGLCRPLQTSSVDTCYRRCMMLVQFEASAAACPTLPLLHGYIGMSAPCPTVASSRLHADTVAYDPDPTAPLPPDSCSD